MLLVVLIFRMAKLRKVFVLLAILALSGYAVARLRALFRSRADGPETVQSRLRQFGPSVARRLSPDFQRAGVLYPPARIALVAFKQERQLEVYGASQSGPLRFIRTYPIKAASGDLGPKLQEGDGQVPEGLYCLEYLNPNSAYHLSMKINYPNEFDRARGIVDGRLQLGGDIMIHGKSISVGCLAMGDAAAEDLFVLAALTGIKNLSVILSPVDFRVCDLPPLPPGARPLPSWTQDLYPKIRSELQKLSNR